MKKLQSLNISIIRQLKELDRNSHLAFIANTSTVAKHRLNIVNSVHLQIEKNPNKAKKAERKLLYEIDFGSSIQELVEQAEKELEKINSKKL